MPPRTDREDHEVLTDFVIGVVALAILAWILWGAQ